MRGRLLPPPAPPAAGRAGWWPPWRGRTPPPAPPPAASLESDIGGHVLRTEVAVGADGSFEALLTPALPPARRGWRIARHQVAYAGQTARACGVVLAPPVHGTALVVLLPDAVARPHAAAAEGGRLTAPLQSLQQGEAAARSVYYVAAVAPGEEGRHAELALAATALGWPAGHFVLVPAEARAAALDRLRWLFAGTLALEVLNLEPALAPRLASWTADAADRAPVRWLPDPAGPGPAPAGPPRLPVSSRVPRYPVVFCHGMLAMSLLRRQLPEHLNYFTPLREFLEERGVRALFPQVAPTGGVAERAAQLRAQILAWTGEPVNLIAHSMGGLDARYLVGHLGMAGRVRSLTTIATPHHGSAVADWFCAHFHDAVPLLLTLKALGLNADGVHDCRRAVCKAFNARTPDAPGVRYFSYGAAVPPARVSPLLRRSATLLAPREGPNDGLVSVASARWGEYLGTLAVDHFGQTPDGRFTRAGEDFDALGFFCHLVEDLAWRGF